MPVSWEGFLVVLLGERQRIFGPCRNHYHKSVLEFGRLFSVARRLCSDKRRKILEEQTFGISMSRPYEKLGGREIESWGGGGGRDDLLRAREKWAESKKWRAGRGDISLAPRFVNVYTCNQGKAMSYNILISSSPTYGVIAIIKSNMKLLKRQNQWTNCERVSIEM